MAEFTASQKMYLRDVLGVTEFVRPAVRESGSSRGSPGPVKSDRSQVVLGSSSKAEPGTERSRQGSVAGMATSLDRVTPPNGWLSTGGGLPFVVVQVSFARDSQEIWLPKEKDLLAKILKAIHQDVGNVQQWERLGEAGGRWSLPTEARTLLIFGLESAKAIADALPGFDPVRGFGRIETIHGCRVLSTHSLTEMLETPAKKRIAWQHLQALLQA
jgi:hypothetical protein